MITDESIQEFLNETNEAINKAYVINEGKDASLNDLRIASKLMKEFTDLIEDITTEKVYCSDKVIFIILEFIYHMEIKLRPIFLNHLRASSKLN